MTWAGWFKPMQALMKQQTWLSQEVTGLPISSRLPLLHDISKVGVAQVPTCGERGSPSLRRDSTRISTWDRRRDSCLVDTTLIPTSGYAAGHRRPVAVTISNSKAGSAMPYQTSSLPRAVVSVGKRPDVRLFEALRKGRHAVGLSDTGHHINFSLPYVFRRIQLLIFHLGKHC